MRVSKAIRKCSKLVDETWSFQNINFTNPNFFLFATIILHSSWQNYAAGRNRVNTLRAQRRFQAKPLCVYGILQAFEGNQVRRQVKGRQIHLSFC